MQKLQYRLLLSGLAILALYHIVVLLGGIGFENVWGGKITQKSMMIRLETISLGIVIASMIIVWQSAIGNHRLWVRVGVWIVSALFFLSAFANLFAQNWIEKIVSVPLALGIGVLACRVALKSKDNYKKELS